MRDFEMYGRDDWLDDDELDQFRDDCGEVDWDAVRDFKREQHLEAMRDDYRAYRRSSDWRHKRELALARAGYRCEQCNVHGDDRQLQVHHESYDRLYYPTIEDLTVLCARCHKIEHGLEDIHWHPLPKKPPRSRW